MAPKATALIIMADSVTFTWLTYTYTCQWP
jgi:hypothetical protein